tara:strand:+ start:3274 stop:3477 length:204 start_codon:yes stop_codon:yes gene_type:complete
MTAQVNSENHQDDTTTNIRYEFTCFSTGTSTRNALEPGDTMSTGKTTASEARLDQPKWPRKGDMVEG